MFGNGDVFEAGDALRLLEATNCDGVAVARGALGNPWLIPRITKYLDQGILDDPPDNIDRLIVAFKHSLGLIQYKGPRVGTQESRRHLCYYTKGIPGGANFRSRLTQITSVEDAINILSDLAFHIESTKGKENFLLGINEAYCQYCRQSGNTNIALTPVLNRN